MFPLDIGIIIIRPIKNRWFPSVSSKDFQRITFILVRHDWLKCCRTKYENRMENNLLVVIL